MIIDGIEYNFTQANFITAKNHALKLIGLLDGCFVSKGDKTSLDIGKALSNLGTDKMKEIEDFIIKYLTVTDENGKSVLINKSEELNSHFNKYRKHYFSVLVEGIKFHFLDFLPSGIASKINTEALAELTA